MPANIEMLDNVVRKKLDAQQLIVFNAVVEKWDKNDQVLILIHGPPGTGKTHLSRCIREAATNRGMNVGFAAIQGIVAAMEGGVTLHYYAYLGIDNKKLNQKRSPEALKVVRRRTKHLHGLVIDEVSMITPQFLLAFFESLRLARDEDSVLSRMALGGLHCIMLCDMYQLSPSGPGARSLYKEAVRIALGQKLGKNGVGGVRVFCLHQRYELNEQHRSLDPVHT